MKLYCPMCEREVDEGEYIYEFLPPLLPEFCPSGVPAVFNAKDCLIRFSHMECGKALVIGKETT
jgi:hypothetical protein